MKPEVWRRVGSLLHAAIQLPVGDRDQFMAAVHADEPEVGRELASLLDAYASARGVLDRGVSDIAAAWLNERPLCRLEAETYLGPYRVCEFIAGGGMGEVYKAEDTRLGRVVALKTLRGGHPAGSEYRRRLLQEARVASGLNHPNIVSVYDVGEVNGTPFIVMEYVSGRVLTECLPMDMASAIVVASQIADALAKAHAAGITHRDLKPANVMVRTDGTVKLLDFGLAKPYDESETPVRGEVTLEWTSTASGVVAGTPAYMSPEQAAGKPVDARSDIFSFGLLLWELLCGRRTGPESRQADGEGSQAPPEGVPPDLERICMRCLNADPDLRFQSMLDVRLMLETVRLSAGHASTARSKVAILPFANLSEEPGTDYLALGLSEEIITLLSQVPGLIVTARTSAFRFHNNPAPLNEIASSLGVSYIVEGSVRRSGNRVRVTARLLSGTDESQVWSNTFEARLVDVFQVQQEIATSIAEALTGILSAKTAVCSDSKPRFDAYDAYLLGRHHLHSMSPDGFAKARDCFQSAIAADPTFAPAYSGLAMYHFWGPEALRVQSSHIEPLLRKALHLDPGLSEAHALLGAHLALYHYDWKAAEREFQYALTSRSVSADSFYHYSHAFLLPLGRTEDALFALQRARHIDPLSPTLLHAVAAVHSCTGEFDKLIGCCQEALRIDDHFWPARLSIAWALLASGEAVAAGSMFKALVPVLGSDNALIACGLVACLMAEGDSMQARSLAARYLGPERPQRKSPWLAGTLHHFLGDIDEALDAINEAIDHRDPRVFQFVHLHRWFSVDLRGLPRFQALLKRLNVPAAIQCHR